MALYKVTYWLKGNRKVMHETEPVRDQRTAINEAIKLKDRCSVVTVVRDREGADHPANAGKFFLDRIIK